MKNVMKFFFIISYVIGLMGGFSRMAEASISQSIDSLRFNSAVLRVSGTARVSATATSGLPVIFNSLTPSTCTVFGKSVTAVAIGTCTVVANQAGDTTYSAALPVSQSLSVTKGNQAIGRIRINPSAISVGGTATVSALASSNLPLVFSSNTPNICTVSGTTVTGLASGSCVVLANQAGDSNYNPVNRLVTVILSKANQSIIFPTSTSLVVGATTTLNATASSGLPVTFSSSTPAVCGINAGVVNSLAVGTCTIIANQAGNDNYHAALPMTQSITVGKANQTIGVISFNPATLAIGGSSTASATASSGFPVTFRSSTPTVCSTGGINGNIVTSVAVGTCTITANQAGNDNYLPATQVTQNLTVGKANQTIGAISFSPATLAFRGTSTVSAMATSGLPVTFSSSTPTVCGISGNVVTSLAVGTCTIAANQAGNGNFNAASSVTQSLTISKVNQTIGAISVNPATLAVGTTSTVSATASSGLPVTFSSSTPVVCGMNAGVVTSLTVGTCTLIANQAGNDTYHPASSVTQNLTVGKANQTIGAISFNPAMLALGGSSTASATASSGLPVTFGSTTPSVCSTAGINGSAVTSNAVGTCTLTASQAGNDTYNAASPMTQSITVGKANQTIGAISFNPATLVIGGTSTASATASSGFPVTFRSSTPTVCSTGGINGNIVTSVAVGTCTITANQAGNDNYLAATQVTQSLTVGKASQTIGTINFSPATLAVGGTSTVSAMATSGLPVTFSSSTPSFCGVTSGNVVTSLAVGTCTVTANQVGNDNYLAAASVTQSLTVGKANQTISVISFTPATLTIGGIITASATASSGLPVTFSSTTPTVCATVGINGSAVTSIIAGTCTISASQTGDDNYFAAAAVTRSLTISKANQTIGTISVSPSTLTVGGSAVVSANATSGLAVAFRVTTPGICTLSGNTINSVSAGTCTLIASQVGDTSYNAALEVSQNLTITKASQTIGTIGFTPASLAVGESATLSATATSSLSVIFSSMTSGVCTISGNRVTGVSAGTCTIAANQAGDASYSAATQVSQAISISPTNQTIGVITFNPASLVVGNTATVSASATSNLAVTFRSTTPSICAVVSGTLTSISAGTCTIVASQSGNANYNAAADLTQDIIIGKANQSIGAITVNPASLSINITATATATATSGLEIVFSSTTPSVCTVSGSTVSGIAVGTCILVANQSGNVNYYAAAEQTKSITVNSQLSFEPEMVAIPAGSFQMGDSSYGTIQVTLAAFEMGKYEVTFDEYDYFANATGRSLPSDSGWGRGKRPVINVDWNDATAYAQWLSTQTGKNYQLPTEAQWEYAAREGTTTAYWWGDAIGSNNANCWGCGDSYSYTAPVGSFSASPWGLYDTVGNVWEWTCSWYGSYSDGNKYHEKCTGNGSSRVNRGGSWGDSAALVRSALRNYNVPSLRNYNLGLRLARIYP